MCTYSDDSYFPDFILDAGWLLLGILLGHDVQVGSGVEGDAVKVSCASYRSESGRSDMLPKHLPPRSLYKSNLTCILM